MISVERLYVQKIDGDEVNERKNEKPTGQAIHTANSYTVSSIQVNFHIKKIQKKLLNIISLPWAKYCT